MSRVVLEQGAMRVEIEPRIGAGIADLSWRVPGRGMTPLMRRAPEGTSWFNDLACYLLAPWSNRIAGGEFVWRGAHHRLEADWPDGTAIHGLVKGREWRLVQVSPVSAVLSCGVGAGDRGFAWAFTAEVGYVVRENGLRVWLEVRNEGGGADAMPVGLGFHPYWLRALDGGPDEVIVRASGLLRYPCEGMIPIAAAREDDTTKGLAAGTALDGMTLDDVFAGSSHGAEILWPRSGVRVRYRCSEELGHTVVFTGMSGSFCLEPVTMVNNGFVMESRGCSGTGVKALAKGKSMRVEWTIEVGVL